MIVQRANEIGGMSKIEEQEKSQTRLRILTDALHSGTITPIRMMLNDLHPAEISHLLEALPPHQRIIVWELVDPDLEGDILVDVNDEVRSGLIREMTPDDLIAATEGLDTDDLADILNDLPDTVIQQVLQSMDSQNRHILEQVLLYPEDSAGGLMNTDTITVRADVTLDVVLRFLRLKGNIPELTDALIVINRFDKYLGLLPLTDLLTRDPATTVAEVMTADMEAISVDTPATEVASLFEHRDLISAPVTDETGRLLGRITIDDVVDVIRDEAEHSLMSMAGLGEEEDMFAPVITSTRRRAVWLGVNLLTAFIASWVIGLFQGTIEQVVALAVLMPIVASMGGVAGSQTLTLTIRGIATGQISSVNAPWLLAKEVAVGFLNGTIWAVVIASIAVYWFGNTQIGYVIAAAIFINMICAALAGITLPLLLRRIGIDPALAGTVVLTTVTDVVGFMAFLGLASLVIL